MGRYNDMLDLNSHEDEHEFIRFLKRNIFYGDLTFKFEHGNIVLCKVIKNSKPVKAKMATVKTQ